MNLGETAILGADLTARFCVVHGVQWGQKSPGRGSYKRGGPYWRLDCMTKDGENGNELN